MTNDYYWTKRTVTKIIKETTILLKEPNGSRNDLVTTEYYLKKHTVICDQRVKLILYWILPKRSKQ